MLQWLADNWYHIAIAVMFLITVIVVIQYIIARKFASMLLTPKKMTKEQAIQRQQTEFGIDFTAYNDYSKELFSYNSDGMIIKGEFIYNENPTNRWVIISHGFTASRVECVKFVYLFYKLGFNCMIYDQRYFGVSQGKFCTLGYFESKDLLNLIDYLYEKQGQDITVGLHGESMGGACVLSVLEFTDKVQFVVADCPFADTNLLFDQIIRKLAHIPPTMIRLLSQAVTKSVCGYTYSKVSPIRAVASTQVPILFIHGAQDNFIDCSHSVKMFDVCKNPISRIVLVPDADHACSIRTDTDEYLKALTLFIDTVDEQIEQQKSLFQQDEIVELVEDNSQQEQLEREKEEELLRKVQAQIQRQMNSGRSSSDEQSSAEEDDY